MQQHWCCHNADWAVSEEQSRLILAACVRLQGLSPGRLHASAWEDRGASQAAQGRMEHQRLPGSLMCGCHRCQHSLMRRHRYLLMLRLQIGLQKLLQGHHSGQGQQGSHTGSKGLQPLDGACIRTACSAGA